MSWHCFTHHQGIRTTLSMYRVKKEDKFQMNCPWTHHYMSKFILSKAAVKRLQDDSELTAFWLHKIHVPSRWSWQGPKWNALEVRRVSGGLIWSSAYFQQSSPEYCRVCLSVSLDACSCTSGPCFTQRPNTITHSHSHVCTAIRTLHLLPLSQPEPYLNSNPNHNTRKTTKTNSPYKVGIMPERFPSR